jgi:hypothetical protein
LVAREIGNFRDNVFSGFASGQVAEHKAYRNTCSLRRGLPRRTSGSLAMWFFHSIGMA